MTNITLKHTHALTTEVRFLGIPTRWVSKSENGRHYLMPLVSQNPKRKNELISDPEDIRKRFFRMKPDEKSALEFLNSVGVWSAEESDSIAVWSDGTLRKGSVVVGERESHLTGAFGHRFIQNGRALSWDVESLCRQRDKWRGLMQSSTRLRKAFRSFSGDSAIEDYIFAVESKYQNTLPVHLEWRGKQAVAVIQPITGEELLKSLAWIDVVSGATIRVCRKCGIEYTHGGWKFCSYQCEHANTVAEWRKRKRNASGEALKSDSSTTI